VPQLSVYTLGAPRFLLDDLELQGFTSNKSRALLAYLAVEHESGHRRSRLAGMLWPDVPERKARHSLSQALTNLRTLLGDREPERVPFLMATTQSVALDPDAACWTDSREFMTLASWDPSQRPPGAESVEALSQAATLYRGRFLTGFSLGDAYLFEEWVLLQRERLHLQAVRVLEALSTSLYHGRAYAEALDYTWRWAELDPWSDRAQRRLIQLLMESGDRALALRQCQAWCRRLREEVGVAPEPATLQLYEELRRSSGPDRQPARPPDQVGATVQVPHNLRMPSTPLLGRRAELARVIAHLDDPACSILSLVGAGGIGKTRLALEAARSVADRYPDGVFKVEFAPVVSAQAIVPITARAVGLQLSTGTEPTREQLLRYLAGKRVLLILDNLEHLPPGADLVADVAARAPGVALLVTSRRQLDLRNETVVRLSPLDLPAAGTSDPGRAMSSPAVQLYEETAQRVDGRFRLTPESTPATVRICRAVGGVPLAILLAASWSHVLPVEKVCEWLDASTTGEATPRLEVLSADWRDVPMRHRSMRAVLEGSWRLLTDRQQRIVGALSAFRAPFTLLAAYEVSGAVQADLRRLVGASIVSRSTGGRLGMHPLLRAYAAEKLALDAEVETVVRQRHADWFGTVLRQWSSLARGPRQTAALDEMDSDIEDARLAWERAVDQGDWAWVSECLEGLVLYYDRRVRLDEGVALVDAALSALQTELAERSSAGSRALARLLTWRAWYQTPEVAKSSLDIVFRLLSSPALARTDTRLEQALALRARASYLSNTDRAQARLLLEAGLRICEDLGDRWQQARFLSELCSLTQFLCEYDEEETLADRLLQIGRDIGDLRAEAWGVNALSGVATMTGDLKAGESLAERSLALCRELADPAQISGALYRLGNKRMFLGRVEEAMACYEENARLLAQHGARHPLCESVRAWAIALSGRYLEASEMNQDALLLAKRWSSARVVAWADYVAGCVALGVGEVEAAVEPLERSRVAFRQLGEPLFLAIATSGVGYACWLMGRDEAALVTFLDAVQSGLDTGSPAAQVFALPGIALLYARSGHTQRALEIRATVAAFSGFLVASQWYQDVAGEWRDLGASELAPDEVSEAEDRGTSTQLFVQAQTVVEAGWPLTCPGNG